MANDKEVLHGHFSGIAGMPEAPDSRMVNGILAGAHASTRHNFETTIRANEITSRIPKIYMMVSGARGLRAPKIQAGGGFETKFELGACGEGRRGGYR